MNGKFQIKGIFAEGAFFQGYVTRKGGVIKYETDRGGRDFEILLKNFVAQHKQQKEFPGPNLYSKKNSRPPKIFSL